jgi:hypothetical protein
MLRSSSGLYGQEQRPLSSLKGLYMYGGVGCGKTFLMDLFVASAPREMQVRLPVHTCGHLPGHAGKRARARGGAGGGGRIWRVLN